MHNIFGELAIFDARIKFKLKIHERSNFILDLFQRLIFVQPVKLSLI